MNFDFKGRHVVVTGGTGALGSAVVGLLIESGAACHVPCCDKAELERFPHVGQARVAEGVDLTDEEAVRSFYARFDGPNAPALWASINIAGGFAMSRAVETSGDAFLKMMNGNALTCFLCCREAARRMRREGGGEGGGGETGGRIVNVASRPGIVPELGAGMVAYTASKAAVAAITQSLAAELAGSGILVNAVVPSIMDTPANRKGMPDADHSKWAKVEEVAATIAFLASPENRVTRGGLTPVYGRA